MDASSSLSRHDLTGVRIHSRLSFNSTSTHLDGYRTTLTAIVQLTENTRVFYSVSVNFRNMRMPAGEQTIAQRLRTSAVNFGAERLDSGAAISRDTGTHTRRRPSKHTRTQTTQHTHKPN